MNANELQHELSVVFTDLKSGKIKPAVASEMINAAGKMINLARLQLEYIRLVRPNPEGINVIQLLESKV